MIFEPLSIPGAFRIIPEPHRDDRGLFARLYCPEEFAVQGIAFTSTQINLSVNPRRHTLRGMHYQAAPHAESKFVRAVCGRAYDVIVDLRPDSSTYKQWAFVELDAETLTAIFVPEGCAHGFLTLEDDTTLLYQVSKPFASAFERGVRWNDPAFAIAWPAMPAVISERDANCQEFT
jgi:dTDP-4-dehydrorhamnose 3,5-epimerase